jgi:hypothetical protein
MGTKGYNRLGCTIVALPLLAAFGPAPAAQGRSLAKLDARLAALAKGRPQVHRKPGAGWLVPDGVDVSASGEILVDVYVRGAMRTATEALRREGMQVEAVSGRSPERMVEGWLPVIALDDAAALDSTQAVLPVPEPIFDTGSVTSQGDLAHRAPQVRAQGFAGSGVPVGVMSDSINQAGTGVAGSQASGNLPPVVQVLADGPSASSDEGRAMAEIVYDEAPAIPKVIFATGFGGPATRANNIDLLVAAGSEVIADDVVYLAEPMFQDGVVAQAADRAKAAGTAYFVSAGNRGRQAWEGTFTPSSVPAENDFDAGPAEDRRQTFATVPGGSTVTLVLQWDDPYNAAASDFALDFYNASAPGEPFLFTVDNNHSLVTHVPTETAGIVNKGSNAAPISVAIRRVAGTGGSNPTPRLKWVYNGHSTTPVPVEHSTNSPAINPDAASARGALAVAAVQHDRPGLNSPESFSSRGPTATRYFDVAGNRLATPDVRPKPDIAAADGVLTDFPSGGLNPFFGTSAAAPSAAGVAALLLSARPSLSVDELYSIMRDPRGAVDCTAPGFPDADCGSGFLLADGKLNMALDSTPPVVTPVTSPAAPNGANGWFRSDVGLTWNVAAGSPIASRSSCGPQSVTADTAVAFTCSATSLGGTTNQPVTIKRDVSPPTAPAISGISAGSFSAAALPAQSSIGCSASDPTSGVDSCVVTGFSAVPGPHVLTATATNNAGLTSSSTLAYSLQPNAPRSRPAAASGLGLAQRIKLSKLLKLGVVVTLNVATDETTVAGTVKLGRKVVGTARATFSQGSRKLTIKLNRSGKALLRPKRSAKLAVSIVASGPNADTAPLTRTLAVTR